MRTFTKGALGVVGIPTAVAGIGVALTSNINAEYKAALIGVSALVGASSIASIYSAVDDIAKQYAEVEDAVNGIFENANDLFEKGFTDEAFEEVFGE